MTKRIQRPAALTSTDPNHPALANPAVARCSKAWRCVVKAEWRATLAKMKEHPESNEEGNDSKSAACFIPSEQARQAYRDAMPPLSGRQNISDFIACLAHGVLIHAIDEGLGNKLLYAAQVALSTLPPQQKPSKVPTPYPTRSLPLPPHFLPGTLSALLKQIERAESMI
jgi:hypothetical protein